MAFPKGAELLTDFSGANGSLKGVTPFGLEGIDGTGFALERVGEQLGKTGSGAGDGREAAESGPDVFRYIEVKALPEAAEGYFFFALRGTSPGVSWNGYGAIFIRTGASTWVNQLRRYTKGASTTLGANNTTAVAVGDKIGASVEGKILKLWRQAAGSETWTLLIEREDSTYSAEGYCAYELSGSAGRYDNLFGATVIEEVSPEERSGTSSISGGGSPTSDGAKETGATSSLSDGGETASTGSREAFGVSTVSGGGSLSSTGGKAGGATSSISGGGSISSSGSKRTAGTSSLSGGGETSSSGSKRAEATSSISGGGAITSTGSGTESAGGASSISGGGSLQSSGRKEARSSSNISGGGELTGTASTIHFGRSSLSGGGHITATGSGNRSSGGTAVASDHSLAVADGADRPTGRIIAADRIIDTATIREGSHL